MHDRRDHACLLAWVQSVASILQPTCNHPTLRRLCLALHSLTQLRQISVRHSQYGSRPTDRRQQSAHTRQWRTILCVCYSCGPRLLHAGGVNAEAGEWLCRPMFSWQILANVSIAHHSACMTASSRTTARCHPGERAYIARKAHVPEDPRQQQQQLTECDVQRACMKRSPPQSAMRPTDAECNSALGPALIAGYLRHCRRRQSRRDAD